MAKEYVFLDEWDVDAPQEAIFEALADARTYPEWWTPVYIEVEGEDPPGQGVTTSQHFKGKLPYTLTTVGIPPCRPSRSSRSIPLSKRAAIVSAFSSSTIEIRARSWPRSRSNVLSYGACAVGTGTNAISFLIW